MSDDQIRTLLKQAPFSFLGTVERLRAATTGEVPIDDRTAIVRVDQVFHAPNAFAHLDGSRITVQLAADVEVGEQYTFFATGLVFGTGIAVTELGRVSVARTAPHVARAAAKGVRPFDDVRADIASEALRDHLNDAVAVVVGRVTKLEKAGAPRFSEHDKDLWKATVAVSHVGKGRLRVGTEIEVLYANSLDVHWHQVPKPTPGQEALFILHKPGRAERSLGKYELQDADDLQPAQSFELITSGA
jgi:hypothetical protein